MPTVTVSERGQIVIPAELRRRLDIRPGARLHVVADTGGFRVLIEPAPKRRTAADCVGIAGYEGPRLPAVDLNGAEAARRRAGREASRRG
jgi:AbrB family looped-hinge helix DNA binding protein